MTLLDFLWRMRWWFLIVGVLVAAYTIGPPKDFRIFQELKSLMHETPQ